MSSYASKIYSHLQVQQLMAIDLLRQQQRWKDGLMDIRHLMASLVEQVITKDNL